MKNQVYILDINGPHGISVKSWLNRDHLALIIVDMQNYMTDYQLSSQWSAGNSEEYYFTRFEKIVLPNIQILREYFNRIRQPVIFLRIAYTDEQLRDVPAGLSRKRLAGDLFDRSGNPFVLQESATASQIDHRLAPEPEDMIISKTSSGAFCTSELDLILRSNGISSLVFTGGITEACVSSSFREAFDRGYLCTLAEDGCISSSEKNHESTVKILGRFFGWTTVTQNIIRES